MPFRMARHAAGLEIRLLMADRTTHGLETVTVRTARDRRLMQPAQIALTRTVAGRMAIDAARMGEHLAEFGEDRRRPRLGVADRCKAFRRCELVRLLSVDARMQSACWISSAAMRRNDPHPGCLAACERIHSIHSAFARR